MSKNRMWDELLRGEARDHEPWASAKGCEQARMVSDIRTAAPSDQGRVLVVDDDPLVLGMTERALRRYGFEVVTASDGPSAIELYRAEASSLDLVILDLTMPGMDGVDTCIELYKVNPDVEVVFASGYDAGAAESGDLPDCVKGFVQKPYRPSDLAQLLYGVIHGKEK